MNKKTQQLYVIKLGKMIDKIFGALGLILIGVVIGYAWRWISLN